MTKGTVYVTMLGTFSLSFQGAQVREPLSRETLHWQLLKYLVENRDRAVGQQELVRVLWRPEDFGPDVCGTIRVRLRRLRESLGPIGLSDSRAGLVLYAQDKYFLNSDYPLELDVQRLRALCRLAGNGMLPAAERLNACREALALCDGPYLERSASALWLEAGRKETAAQFRSLALAAMDLGRQERDLSLGGLLSARVLRMAPEDEELNTRLMIFLMDQGCTAEAVNHYAQLVRMAEAGGKKPPPLKLRKRAENLQKV